ncbi:MAG: acylphosphatase [bacterium]
MSRVRLVVRGRVQGVGFRYAAVDQARRLRLIGWARNLPDGAVEIVAEGPDADVQALQQWAQRGPPSARVLRVEESAAPSDELGPEFRVRF